MAVRNNAMVKPVKQTFTKFYFKSNYKLFLMGTLDNSERFKV